MYSSTYEDRYIGAGMRTKQEVEERGERREERGERRGGQTYRSTTMSADM